MATPNIEDYSNITDEELEARQRVADGEDPNTDPKVADPEGAGEEAGGADPQPTPTPTPVPTPEPTPTPAPAADNTAGGTGDTKVEGVLSKDGSRVLPYGALQAARRDARRAENKAQRLERELVEAKQRIDDLKSGKTPASEMTEEEVIQMEQDYPNEGKKMRALFTRLKELEQQAPARREAGEEDDPPDNPVQDIIDAIPQLLEWQHSDPEKFARAQEIDTVLAKSPKWVKREPAERFLEVTRQVCDEHDLAFNDPSKASSTPTPQPTAAPAGTPKPTPEPQRRTPETLSDFKGGAAPGHASFDWSGASAVQQLTRMSEMSDEEIDRLLAKQG